MLSPWPCFMMLLERILCKIRSSSTPFSLSSPPSLHWQPLAFPQCLSFLGASLPPPTKGRALHRCSVSSVLSLWLLPSLPHHRSTGIKIYTCSSIFHCTFCFPCLLLLSQCLHVRDAPPLALFTFSSFP